MTADVTGTARDEGAQVAGTARAEAEAVGGSAVSAAQDVAETAAEQAGQVAGEGVRGVRELLDDLRDEVTLQASTQTMRAGELAYTLADDLESMAAGSEQQGVAAEAARSVASQARRVGEFLQSRDPDQLLDEVRVFARRRPGAFLLGAAAAGIVAGRLGRGAAATRGGTSASGAPAGPATPPAAAPVTVPPGAVVPEPPEDAGDGEGTAPGDLLGQEAPAAPVAAGSAAASAGAAGRAAAEARRAADARRVRR